MNFFLKNYFIVSDSRDENYGGTVILIKDIVRYKNELLDFNFVAPKIIPPRRRFNISRTPI